jgi:hypothetical protein
MRTAEIVALVYFFYLAIVGVARGPGRAALASACALIGAGIVAAAWRDLSTPLWLRLVRDTWPLLLLFIGYRVAGLFYVQPDTALEARLLRIDWRAADRLQRLVGPRVVDRTRPWLEAAYVGVYLLIPLGAVTIAVARPDVSIDRFWTSVLIAGFACYGVLPWIQTRPPRDLERSETDAGTVRRLNLAILARGSVGANTLPSGHAATAVTTALWVASATPLAGAAFILAAVAIAIATIVGRYHFLVDTALGVVVGALSWLAVTAAWTS